MIAEETRSIIFVVYCILKPKRAFMFLGTLCGLHYSFSANFADSTVQLR